MLFLLFQEQYFANYGMNIIECLACLLFLIFFVKLASKPLIEEKEEIRSRKISLCILLGVSISFGITLSSMFIIAFIGWYSELFRIINNIYFSFALMATLSFPFYNIMLKKFSKSEVLLHPPERVRSFQKRFWFIIIVSWIVVALFLSTDLLNIPIGDLIPKDPISPNFDVFLLGFEWAFIAVFLYTLFIKLVLFFLPMDKRPPKEVVDNSLLVGALVSYGIWSIQLIIVELFLSRFFGIHLYDQDIRMLALIVAITYVSGFLFSLKFKFLPESIEADRQLIKKKMLNVPEGTSQDMEDEVILNVEDLITYFYTEEGIVHAVEGVSFQIHQGEVLGLVGETGCGKSVTALSILQLIQNPGKILGGKVVFEGEDLLKKTKSEILNYRGHKITMIFQDPLNSLNPVFTVGKQISEVYLLHKKKDLLLEASRLRDRSIFGVARMWSEKLLKDLNIPSPENVIDRYPHELSGGMRQRIQIAMALAGNPKLLIADEPTTALDVTVQNQILKLMKNLKKKYNTSILFITHDLGIISKMCNRVAVMYGGSIVEYGKINRLFETPYHPYTRGLLSAVPIEGKENEDLAIIPGMVPNLIYPPSGCRFHPRCIDRFEPCDSISPKKIEVEKDYFVNCHLYDPEYNYIKEVKK